MAVNKVILSDGTELINLQQDTVEAQYLKKGKTAHKKDGSVITGTAESYVQNAVLFIPFGEVEESELSL